MCFSSLISETDTGQDKRPGQNASLQALSLWLSAVGFSKALAGHLRGRIAYLPDPPCMLLTRTELSSSLPAVPVFPRCF